MQSKEKLSFVEPFDPFVERREFTAEELQLAAYQFLVTCKKMLNAYNDDVVTFDRLEESGFITCFELSLKVPTYDGSYLHSVIFGHKNEGGLLGVGVCLTGHDEEGNNQGGYLYTYDETGVVLRSNALIGNEEFGSEEDPKTHFSIVDLYEYNDQLIELEMSHDEHSVTLAAQARAGLDRDLEFSDIEQDMGMDGQPVSIEEIESIEILVKDAVPFPRNEFPETNN